MTEAFGESGNNINDSYILIDPKFEQVLLSTHENSFDLGRDVAG